MFCPFRMVIFHCYIELSEGNHGKLGDSQQESSSSRLLIPAGFVVFSLTPQAGQLVLGSIPVGARGLRFDGVNCVNILRGFVGVAFILHHQLPTGSRVALFQTLDSWSNLCQLNYHPF